MANTTGNNNTANGFDALYNTTGTANTAVVSVRYSPIKAVSSTRGIGELSLERLTDGSGNTAIGSASLLFVATGSGDGRGRSGWEWYHRRRVNNVCVGVFSGTNIGTTLNVITIGSNSPGQNLDNSCLKNIWGAPIDPARRL